MGKEGGKGGIAVLGGAVSGSGEMCFPAVRKIHTSAEMHFLTHNSKVRNKLYKYCDTLSPGGTSGVTRAAEIYCELINGKTMPLRIM